MDSYETAMARLDAALDRLESAADRLIARGRLAAADPDLAAQLAEVRGERDRLRGALDSAQRHNEELRSVSQAVSDRLDDTIGRVRVLLEEGDGPSHGSH